jgi:uncharacterized protein YkwD
MQRRQFIVNSLGFGLVLVAGPDPLAAAADQLVRRPIDRGLLDGRWRLDMLGRLNIIREQNALRALRLDERLNRAAQLHSDDMASRNYFDHQTPEGSRMTDRADAFGYRWRLLLENIAAGQENPAEAVAGWMESAGHRAAILNAKGQDAGMGHSYRAPDDESAGVRHYWTLLIGTE